MEENGKKWNAKNFRNSCECFYIVHISHEHFDIWQCFSIRGIFDFREHLAMLRDIFSCQNGVSDALISLREGRGAAAQSAVIRDCR